jgi:hypothetical protein
MNLTPQPIEFGGTCFSKTYSGAALTDPWRTTNNEDTSSDNMVITNKKGPWRWDIGSNF